MFGARLRVNVGNSTRPGTGIGKALGQPGPCMHATTVCQYGTTKHPHRTVQVSIHQLALALGCQKNTLHWLQRRREHGFEHFVVGDHEEWPGLRGLQSWATSLGRCGRPLPLEPSITASIGLPSSARRMSHRRSPGEPLISRASGLSFSNGPDGWQGELLATPEHHFKSSMLQAEKSRLPVFCVPRKLWGWRSWQLWAGCRWLGSELGRKLALTPAFVPPPPFRLPPHPHLPEHRRRV